MPREPAFSDPEFSSSGSDSDDTFSGDVYRRDSHLRPRSPAANAGSSSHRSSREDVGESNDTELRPRHRGNDPPRQMDSDSEPDDGEEPQSSRRQAAQERHGTERLTPQGDEYRRQAMEASNRENTRRPRPGMIDVDDEELQRVYEASRAEQNARERRMRRREEEIAAREAADEAVAIAESARLAAKPTAAQRRETDADAELERVLRESAAEVEEKEAREQAALASLHAGFGANGVQQPSSGSSRDSGPPASSHRGRANSAPRRPTAPSSGQRERAKSAPRRPAAPSTGQRESANSVPRELPASSTERLIAAGSDLLRQGAGLVRKPSAKATPAISQPRRAASARLAEISPNESEPPTSPAARPNPPRAAANPPRAAPTPARAPQTPTREHANPPRAAPTPARAPRIPTREHATSPRVVLNSGTPPNCPREHAAPPRRHSANPRRQPQAPAPQPNTRGRRNSGRAPHVGRTPIRRASSTSSGRRPEGAGNRRELDPSIRQALNNSERLARLEQGRGGGRNLREEDQMRMAIQNSLGDAPPPPDPIEGLIDPPPAYNKIGGDKKLDPRRYTTTNDKGNEPGFKRYITPEILAVMKKASLQQQKFNAKAKAAGNDLPPANNAMAKKQKRAPVVDNSAVAGSSSSAADPVDSLENILGTRLPPPRLARSTPTARAAASSNDNGFVSRVPGLAGNARERIPQARPWANAFSRLPGDMRSPGRRF